MFRVPELCSSPIVLASLLVPRFSARVSRHCGSSFSAAADCDASDAAAAAAATRCLLLPVLLLMFLVLSQRLVQSSLRVVGGLVCSALHSAACHIFYVAATHTHTAQLLLPHLLLLLLPTLTTTPPNFSFNCRIRRVAVQSSFQCVTQCNKVTREFPHSFPFTVSVSVTVF